LRIVADVVDDVDDEKAEDSKGAKGEKVGSEQMITKENPYARCSACFSWRTAAHFSDLLGAWQSHNTILGNTHVYVNNA
jgi:hypothetical protein